MWQRFLMRWGRRFWVAGRCVRFAWFNTGPRPLRTGAFAVDDGVGTLGLLCIAVVIVVFAAAAPGHAESYAASGTSTLVRDATTGELRHDWEARCETTDPSADARIASVALELRFSSDADQVWAVAEGQGGVAAHFAGSGTFRWPRIDGAYVFGRHVVRCGTAFVFDEQVIDSNPVVTPPVVTAPHSVTRTKDLVAVDPLSVPVGTEVVLGDIHVDAWPRGDDRVELAVRGAGVLVQLSFGATDFVEGKLTVSPPITPLQVGPLEIIAVLRGQESEPVVLQAAMDGDDAEGQGDFSGVDDSDGVDAEDGDQVAMSCGAALPSLRRSPSSRGGDAAWPPGLQAGIFLMVVVLGRSALWRRTRGPRRS
jgi:hypothetical protein